ncbi:hypothetical protein PHISCL_04577 [Aspergillus sclerotialis]|uniref:Aminoglycoside phosphotransferase domain-containing protein n=1 Tax=Aspergillus sclerotialis TaxID=2070753 RepID=A0A3A2ZNT7_9EURO|nr:hypothetical protein PHISCL_04577 [Aspergillus sclerotialis]
MSDTAFSNVTVIKKLYRSYNVVYIIEFDDEKKFVFRVPIDTNKGHLSETAKRSIISQVQTMHFIRKNTTIPVPEIYTFDTSKDTIIGTPYIAMSFIEGEPVCSLWFKEIGPTPREERRHRILRSIAQAMSQLHAFSFEKAGSLRFSREPKAGAVTIDPCYVWSTTHLKVPGCPNPRCLADQDAESDRNSMCSECRVSANSRDISDVASEKSDEHFADGAKQSLFLKEIGPFRSSEEYFKAVMHSFRGDSKLPIPQLTSKVLETIIHCLPFPTQSPDRETFVLSPPDFNYQNIMADEEGNITGFIDWDNVHTVPRQIGYCRYPGWITRDWDSGNHEDYQSHPLEDPPGLLVVYRTLYRQTLNGLLGPEQDQVIRQTLVFGAIEKAIIDDTNRGAIVRNMLRKALSVSLKEAYRLIPEVEEWTEKTKEQLKDGLRRALNDCM